MPRQFNDGRPLELEKADSCFEMVEDPPNESK